ncbi:MAG: hypothetical protein AAGA92_11400 [Planctomycetota bacterium]
MHRRVAVLPTMRNTLLVVVAALVLLPGCSGTRRCVRNLVYRGAPCGTQTVTPATLTAPVALSNPAAPTPVAAPLAVAPAQPPAAVVQPPVVCCPQQAPVCCPPVCCPPVCPAPVCCEPQVCQPQVCQPYCVEDRVIDQGCSECMPSDGGPVMVPSGGMTFPGGTQIDPRPLGEY